MDRLPTLGRSLLRILLVTGLALSGCTNPNLSVAPVSGTVTLDGAPLKKASVTFQPNDGGRPSFGVTNDQGRYVLEYSLNELGAKVGVCTVRITTENRGDDGKVTKEMVPKSYKTKPIEVKVESKSNTIDIALLSK